MNRPSAALRIALAGLVAAAAMPALAQEIGTAGAVNPATTGTPPNRPTRTLELGSRVVFRERVTTSAVGTAQIIFTDKSTLSLGPNSAVVIDEYVYDPSTGTGRMAATLTKGLLRFVGGATSHTGGAQITTPAATIGIRGGVGTVSHGVPNVSQTDGTWAALHFGRMTVSSQTGRQDITRPGFAVTVAGLGAPPMPPVRVSTAQMASINTQLTSKPGQSGGRPASPTAVAQAAQAAPTIGQTTTSAPSLQSQSAARQVSRAEALGLSTAPTDATSPTQIQQVSSNVNRQVTTQNSQETAIEIREQQTATPTPQPQPQPDPQPQPRPLPPARAFALNNPPDPSLGSGAPFLPANFVGGQRNFQNSQVLGYGTGGANPDGSPNTTRRVLQAGLHITGQGASQTSAIYVFVGNSFQSTNSNQPTFSGGFTATSRQSANAFFPGRANGGFVGNGTDVVLNSEFVPTSITGRPGSTDANDRIVPEPAFYFRGDGSPGVDYNFTQTATSTATPAGLGANRPTANLSGVATGLMRTSNQTARTSGPVSAFSGAISVPLEGGTSRFGSVITRGTGDPNADPGISSMRLPYGFQGDGTQTGRGTYVDYDNFGAREARASGIEGEFLATVNGAQVDQHRGVLVTSQTVNAPSFFPNTTFCQCEYTRWGFWSSDTVRVSNGSRLQDLLHLGTWVAGQPTALGNIPTAGTATYTGHIIGTIQNGPNQYTAASNFTNTVNFGTRTGAVAIPNLDGRAYSGTVSLQAGANQFSGNLTSSGATAPANMGLAGQFGRGASGPAGEMYGGFGVTGTNYLGRGIFAASTPGVR